MSQSALSGRRLGLIGAGRMAEALTRGVLNAGLLPPESIIASDPDESRRDLFASLGVRTAEDNKAVLADSDIILLAVKPQILPAILKEISPAAEERHLFVSIAAGVPTGKIESSLPPSARVVRVMPNTPMQVGRGASAVARGSRAGDDDVKIVLALFGASGVAVEMPERHMDAVTALSGSGPAYAFFLAECMMEAAAAEGLDRSLARTLAAATIEGAGAMLASSGDAPEELRARVTSPGGTTEAAFKIIEEKRLREHLVAAVRRAAARSRELAAG